MWDWLTRGAHELLIEAVHRRQQSDHADRVVRKYAANPKLVERLDEAADTIQEQIRLLFIETRVEKSRRAYERAQDLCPCWNRAASLYEWTLNPTVAYRSRNFESFPEALSVEEHLAAVEGLGETRLEVPDRLLAGRPSSSPPDQPPSRESKVHMSGDGPGVM